MVHVINDTAIILFAAGGARLLFLTVHLLTKWAVSIPLIRVFTFTFCVMRRSLGFAADEVRLGFLTMYLPVKHSASHRHVCFHSFLLCFVFFHLVHPILLTFKHLVRLWSNFVKFCLFLEFKFNLIYSLGASWVSGLFFHTYFIHLFLLDTANSCKILQASSHYIFIQHSDSV